MEEHISITYIPPLSKSREKLETSPIEMLNPDHDRKDHYFKQNFEKPHLPENATTAPVDTDVGLAKIQSDDIMSVIKAWEDSKKAKADNKAQNKMSSVLSWENTKRASMEAKLREKHEALEKKKKEYTEKVNNVIASIHNEAEIKRAAIEAKRSKSIVKAEEMAAKYRSTRSVPNRKNL